MTKIAKKDLVPIILVVLLLFVSIACANMLIPSYAAIEKEFNIPEALIAIPDAFFILFSAFFALIWGYYTDRIDRGKVIMGGAFSWTIGMLLTSFSTSFQILLFSRIISGAGLGCVLPVGYSIISDAIPPEERSGWFGMLAILSSISNGIGQALSSFLGPATSWRFPFLLLAIISIFIIIILFFIKIPQRGASEDELLDLAELSLEYSYKISTSDLAQIIRKKTNRYLTIQAFFAIIPGTILVYFLTSMFALHFFVELPEEIRLQTASIFAGMVGIGYILGNIILSRIGDALFKRNKRNRARLATVCIIITIPLYLMTMFFIQPINVDKLNINYPDDIPAGETWNYIILTVGAIFRVYPSYILYFIFGLIGTTIAAGSVANRNAILIDVNMPEHKGTAASFFNLSEQIGKGITLLISFMLIMWLGSIYNMMVFAIIFWIPAAILWYIVSKNVEDDMFVKSRILTERKQITLIDYIFELEIQMDRAIQKVQDSKYYLESDTEKFNKLLDDAIRIFVWVEREGESRSITNIEKKAGMLKRNALLIKEKTNTIHNKLKDKNLNIKEKDLLYEQLRDLKLKIVESEKSTFGELQTFYEVAYLKIVEARLLRNYDLIKCMIKINEAISIYHRTKHLLKERMEERSDKDKLSEEESIISEKEKDLYENCTKSLTATVKLKNEIESVFTQLDKIGIHQEDFAKITELTSEYEIQISSVIVDTLALDKKLKKAITEILQKIEQYFNEYDESFKIFLKDLRVY
ncbi:MAG: MFS transporter [Promethearchaeota archaeon]|nr:MAG: MFS transporter [Candidatus Lokiarchaeota archaeon]